jgi:peroxiredoxin
VTALRAALFTSLLFLPAVCQKQTLAAWTEQEKPMAGQIRGLRQLPDDQRAVVTLDLALRIRELPASPNKLRLAVGLANLSTEGDFGRETLQQVTTTLAAALRELPVASAPDKPAPPYVTLAQLVHYEHMRVSWTSEPLARALSELEAADRRRQNANFTLSDLNGHSWTLSDLKGKVVLVNYWATWCPPCRKEMPDLEALYQDFQSEGLVVLAISDEDEAKVRAYLGGKNYTFPVLLDPGRKAHASFEVEGIPRSFVYDRAGRLVAQSIDMRTRGQFLAMLAQAGLKESRPVSLFDGRTLNGWRPCNGAASYRVDNGTILGTTVEGSPNSFLCSEREYGDFVLELETMTDPALNSGIQIRSHRYPAGTVVQTFDGRETREHRQPAGRVYGYQVEVSNEQSGTSGGIYDEARRGWLENTSSKPACKAAFKDHQWNRYRIEARGDVIRTWVNGAECANLVDASDLTGFIALQVHAYQGEKPASVRWRNIRITDLGKHTWKPLWDGSTFNGWTKSGGVNWTIENGAIHGVSLADDPRIGFLTSEQSFGDVTARVRFRIPKGNSGFFLRCDPVTHKGYEVEIDAEKRTGGFWDTAGRNWVTGPEDNANVRPDDWNEIIAHFRGHRVVFQLNGQTTVNLPDDSAGRLDGHIALQAHGARRPTEVWFKDIAVLVPAQ